MRDLLRGPTVGMLPLAVLACCSEAEPELDGRAFVSTSVTSSGSEVALVEGTRLVLDFYAPARVMATAGCSDYDFSYAIDRGFFLLSYDSWPLMPCSEALAEQEDWYTRFLLAEPLIAVSGDRLVLQGAHLRIEYLDQELATPDLELTAFPWMLDAYTRFGHDGRGDWSEPAGLSFDPDGSLMIDTGCNTGTGAYAVSGSRLTFADVVVGERRCATARLAEQEEAVVDLLRGPQPVTWEITVDRLSLRGEHVTLELVARDG